MTHPTLLTALNQAGALCTLDLAFAQSLQRLAPGTDPLSPQQSDASKPRSPQDLGPLQGETGWGEGPSAPGTSTP